MARKPAPKSTYLVILRTHVDEAVSMVRIARSRARRRLAQWQLAQRRRRSVLERAVADKRRGLEALVERVTRHGRR